MTSSIMIIQARFYSDIADELYAGACEYLDSRKAVYRSIEVPGVFEIPAALAMVLASSEDIIGAIALGCVIRGETSHYDYVCGESARGLNDLAIGHVLPLGYGILTVESEVQAWRRAKRSDGNKGGKAAEACLHMLNLKHKLGS